IINSNSTNYLHDGTGRRLLLNKDNSYDPVPKDETMELPSGKYFLEGASGLITVDKFEIRSGENTVLDFKKYVGSLRVVNSAEEQYLYTEAERLISIDGKFMSTMPPNAPVELPPGRYFLKTGNPYQNPRVTAEPFEIKAGEETVIDFGG